MKNIFLYIIIVNIIIGLKIKANEDGGNYDIIDNTILLENIKSVQLYKKGWVLAPPYLELNGGNQLELTFDELDGEARDFKYTIKHCSYDWKYSDISELEYIDGFNEGFVEDYKYSNNTLQEYVHYKVSFPSEDSRITKSGNYVIILYEDDVESPVLIRRFFVYESVVSVEGKVVRATSAYDINHKQEVDFKINFHNIDVIDPYQEVKVIIQQNGRWDNAIRNVKPRMIRGNVFDYNYDNGNVFNGGAEFRYIDIKSIQHYSPKTIKITRLDNEYHVILKSDLDNSFSGYRSQQDINGRMAVYTEDYDDSDIESEYVYVHLSLPYEHKIINGKVTLIGDLFNWRYSSENELKYNNNIGAYTIRLYLKQGFYNYQYALYEDNKDFSDETYFEGNHSETENDYFIYVYFRSVTATYDRLMVIKKLNSTIVK